MLGSWYGVEKFPRDTIVTHEGLKSSLVGIPELSRADWHPEGGVVHPKVPQRLMTINKKLCKEKLGHLHIHKALARYSKNLQFCLQVAFHLKDLLVSGRITSESKQSVAILTPVLNQLPSQKR